MGMHVPDVLRLAIILLDEALQNFTKDLVIEDLVIEDLVIEDRVIEDCHSSIVICDSHLFADKN
jgi:hypothetical protein